MQNQKDSSTKEQDLLKTKCDGNKLTQSIKLNLQNYNNDHNIDGKEIYKKFSKKNWNLKGTYFDESIEFDSITE